MDSVTGSVGYLDLVILAIIIFGAWGGFRGGAIRQVIGVASGILAIVLGVLFSEPVGQIVISFVGLDAEFAPLAGFVTICVLAFALAGIAGMILRTVLRALKLGFIDTLGGVLLGSLKMILMMSVFFVATSSTLLPAGIGALIILEETRNDSLLYRPVEMAAPAVWEAFRALAPGWQDSLLEMLGTEQDDEEIIRD